mmetsp:Transcript_38068/g.72980  ORF Transcript_38068/g.72980 Transcript_38068/m.72980 type:complete len:377 (+) Transcript_38068:326-1456(+)
MLGQAKSKEQVEWGIKQFGPAPGGKKLMKQEHEAAMHALHTGVYVTWRSTPSGTDCSRVGPSHKCFCGHRYSDHSLAAKGKTRGTIPKCTLCPCRAFDFVPSRPEEVGEWWLPRRKGFNVHAWRAKCRCGKAHDEHDPVSRGGCCSGFSSSYLCVVCECHQEQHETVFESELERAQAGRPVGKEFMPLADMPETQRLVLGGKKAALPVGTLEDQLNSGAITTQQYYQMIQSSDQDAAAASAQGAHSSLKERALRPPNALDTHGQVEKSVRIMHENCGGRSTGTALNAYGLTEDNLIAHGTSRAQARWLKNPPGTASLQDGSHTGTTSQDAIKEVEEIYRKFAPGKIGNLPALKQKYQGREQELLEKIRCKYCDESI